MPQMGLGKQAAISGLLQGLIGGYGQSQQRRLEQERKGTEDQMKNLTAVISDYKQWQELDPGDPLRPLLEQKMTLAYGHVPGQQPTPPERRVRPVKHTPLGDLEAKFARPMMQPRLAGETALRARPQMRADVIAGGRARMAPAVAKPPTASTIAFARRTQEKYTKDIEEAETRIAKMQKDWKLAPGETPRTPGGYGRKGEQERLDEWNKWQRQLATAQASLDSLRKASAERGIDLEFGAPTLPTPEEVSGMSLEEIKQGIFPDIK